MQYNSFNELYTKFNDIVINNKNSFNYFFDLVKNETPKELFDDVYNYFMQKKNDAIQLLQNEYLKIKDDKNALLKFLCTAQKKNIHDVYKSFINTHSELNKGLLNLINNNIAIYPCNNETRTPLKKIYKGNREEGNREIIKENQITTLEKLYRYQHEKKTTAFCFYPAMNNMLVIDLDNSDKHANKVNGIQNFIDFINSVDLSETQKTIYKNFPENFPCYCKTVNNGLHLYYKASFIKELKNIDTARFNKLNIELKYNTQVTTPDTLRDNKYYTLYGAIENAPEFNYTLQKAMSKKETPRTYTNNSFAKKNNNTSFWNKTPDGVINKAFELYSDLSPHDFIFKTSLLFYNSKFSKDIATQYITNTNKHITRNNKQDTFTTIASVYNR